MSRLRPRRLAALGAALVGVGITVFLPEWWKEQRLQAATLSELEAIASREPRNPAAHFYLGCAREGVGEHGAAVESYRAARPRSWSRRIPSRGTGWD